MIYPYISYNNIFYLNLDTTNSTNINLLFRWRYQLYDHSKLDLSNLVVGRDCLVIVRLSLLFFCNGICSGVLVLFMSIISLPLKIAVDFGGFYDFGVFISSRNC